MHLTGFAAIAATADQALAKGKIGTVVGARLVMHTLADQERIPWLLARMVLKGAAWFESTPAVVWISGDVLTGQWSGLVRFAGGQSLLASAGVRRPVSVAQLTLFGNHGILNYEGDINENEADDAPPATDEEKKLLAFFRQAIQTRQAVDISATSNRDRSADETEAKAANFDLFAKSKHIPPDPPYGVLLVAGDHTHQPSYAEAFAADRRCSIVGLVDDRPSADRQHWNQQYAQRSGIRLFNDFQEAVARPDVHIVSICAEPERRAAMIIAAAQARKHLYLDKPLCATLDEAVQIVAAVRDHRVIAQMFSQVHWDPAVRVREILATGELGELLAVHCDLTFAKGHIGGAQLGALRTESPAPNRFELPDAKRELTNIGVYPLVMLLTLLRRKIKRVFASTGNYFFAEHQSRDMEDFGQILMELDGGIAASITAARTGWLSHPAGGLHRIVLIGAKKSAVIDAHRPRLEAWADGEAWRPPARDPEDPLAMWATVPGSAFRAAPKTSWFTPAANAANADVAEFLDHLQRGDDGEVTVEIAAAAQEVLMAAYRSAASLRVAKV